MVVPDDAVQAGSIRMRLAPSAPAATSRNRPFEWTDITKSALGTFGFFLDLDSSQLFSSLLRLTSSHVGRKPNQQPVIYAFYKVYEDSLVVRLYLSPWVGPSDRLKPNVRRDLEGVIGRLLNRWEWDEGGGDGTEDGLVFQNKDYRQISALYQTIPSPSPALSSVKKTTDSFVRRVTQTVLAESGGGSPEGESVGWRSDGGLKAMGMRTELYGYQRRSVAQMILQESCPQRFEDIRFVKMREVGRDGEYFIDLQSGEVRRQENVGLFELPRGGILCEEMGTGKTIITLSLILATSQQRTSPDPAKPHTPILTEKGIATIPHLRHVLDRADNQSPRQQQGASSLVDMAIHRHLSYRSGHLPQGTVPGASLPLQDAFLETMTNDHPFYHEIAEDEDRNLRTSSYRVRQRDTSVKIYLSCASLIIVPRLLLKQWEGEIEKHFKEGALRYITVGKDLPSRDEVLNTDIVLITDARFREAEKEIHNNVKEGIDFDIFTKIRWKRVVVEEGHIANTANGSLMTLARKTCSEAFWAVSGTPTKHALSSITFTEDSSSTPRAWSPESMTDLKHLLGIMTNLLQMKPFDVEGKNAENSANTLVVKPLAGKDGPCFGAVGRIEDLIHLVMVRTREQDIRAEVEVPPCDERKHSLDLDYYASLTYNVLQAMFVVNAILSERVGSDYLLTPSNRSSLLIASRNLQLACCWLPSSTDEINPGYTLSVLESEVKKPGKLAALSEADRGMIAEAERWLGIALNDERWHKLLPMISVPILLGSLPSDILRATSLSTIPEDGTVQPISLTTAGVPLALRASAATITNPDSISGNLITAAQFAKKKQPRLAAAQPKRKDTKKIPEQSVSVESKSRSAAKSLRRSEQAATQERQRDIHEVEVLDDDQPSAHSPRKRKRTRPNAYGDRDSRSEIDKPNLPVPPEVRAIEFSFNTVSSKLDWVVAETLRESDDYFLVFAKDSVMLGQLTDCLDLAGISSCYVGTGSNIKAREAAIELFQQKRRRVCLMEVELAGRGLNLIVANRVIFVEPVWKEDLQRQAIARIHRIGQHRPTACDILYIKGSQEEEVLERRHRSQAQNAEDDDIIRGSIAYPRFLHDVAPARAPFVVKLLDPSASGNTTSTPAATRDPAEMATGDVRSEESPDVQRRNGDAITEIKSRPVKRARFATTTEAAEASPIDSKGEEHSPIGNNHASSTPPTKPRKKAKVTFIASPDDDL